MNDIKVSVILPVYNVEKYLEQCLDSIINQTLKEIEIICVDDGSKDSSPEILRKYADDDDRIVVITQQNAGAGAARNNGLSKAKGEYLIFLDSDDFFEHNMLEVAYDIAVRDNSDIVVFDSDQYYEADNSFRYTDYYIKRNSIPNYSPFNHYAFTDNAFNIFIGWAWDKLFKADFVRKNNLLFQEQRTTNDMLFVYTAVVIADRISISDSVLAHQRRNLKTSLSSTRERSWECFYLALKALKNNLISYNLMEELEQDYINYVLHFSLWNFETIAGPKKEVLYNKLKNEWFAELGVMDKDSSYFYNAKEYKKLLRIKNKSFEEYMKPSVMKQKVKGFLKKGK